MSRTSITRPASRLVKQRPGPSILHLMGFGHEKLTYRHAGRDFRLTDVHGRVVKGVPA